jgi:hypothetical protein
VKDFATISAIGAFDLVVATNVDSPVAILLLTLTVAELEAR